MNPKYLLSINPFRGKDTLNNFTLANTRWFFLSREWAMTLNELIAPFIKQCSWNHVPVSVCFTQVNHYFGGLPIIAYGWMLYNCNSSPWVIQLNYNCPLSTKGSCDWVVFIGISSHIVIIKVAAEFCQKIDMYQVHSLVFHLILFAFFLIVLKKGLYW